MDKKSGLNLTPEQQEALIEALKPFAKIGRGMKDALPGQSIMFGWDLTAGDFQKAAQLLEGILGNAKKSKTH